MKKTALHLLSVFVGYADTNANIFVETVDDFHKSSSKFFPPGFVLCYLIHNFIDSSVDTIDIYLNGGWNGGVNNIFGLSL